MSGFTVFQQNYCTSASFGLSDKLGVAVSAIVGGTSAFVSSGVSIVTWCRHSWLAAGSIPTSVSDGARDETKLAAAADGGAGPAAAGSAGQGPVDTETVDSLAAAAAGGAGPAAAGGAGPAVGPDMAGAASC